ncbi:LacI family DNA-binding transcriptional regulator [Arthrobacter sp. TMN-49]
MPVKLIEVARHAGVSLATASRVINGSSRTPAAEIARRVKSAAEELGYVANAQALARSTTGLVGLVVHDIADPYFSATAHGVQQAALQSHHQELLAGTDIAGDGDSPGDAELAAVNAFVSYRTDAIILAASRLLQEDLRLTKALSQYIHNGGRVVTLGTSAIPDAQVLTVANREGATALLAALVAQGIIRLGILAGPHESNTARVRVEGFMQGLAAAKLEPLAVVHGAFTSTGGYDATLEYLDSLGDTGDVLSALKHDAGSPGLTT